MKAEIRGVAVVIIAETKSEVDFLKKWYHENDETPHKHCIGRHGKWEMITPSDVQ